MKQKRVIFSQLSELYNLDQVAQVLGVHKRTVSREIQRGKMKAHKVGSMYRIRREDLEAYLNATEVIVNP